MIGCQPTLFALDQALAAVEGRKEFAVVRYDGLVCFNYLFTLDDSFEGIRQNFRGVTFDEQSGDIVSLPFHKFFNVNQTEETQWHKLRHLDATISSKEDGSLIHFFLQRGTLRAATRMSANTPQAAEALAFVERDHHLLDKIVMEIQCGWTPLFEWCTPHGQIVVEYPRPRLIYLNQRHRVTGQYHFNPFFPDCVQRHTFPFARIMDELADRRDFEGYVCQLSNGLWVKAKCDWYLERHRAVDAMMRPAWRLYEMALDGILDDVIVKAADRYKPSLRKIGTQAATEFLAEQDRVLGIAKAARCITEGADLDPRENRKRYALYVQERYRDLMSELMAAYSGKDVDAIVRKRLIEGYQQRYPRKVFADLEEE